MSRSLGSTLHRSRTPHCCGCQLASWTRLGHDTSGTRRGLQRRRL